MTEYITKKNELKKEAKITASKTMTEGTQGARNIPVKYETINITYRSMTNHADLKLSYAELAQLRKVLTDIWKDLLKKEKKSKVVEL
jgi:hypothetical protein